MEKKEKLPISLPEFAKEYNITTQALYVWLLPIRQELLDMYATPRKRLRLLLPKQSKRIKEFLM